LVDTPRQVNLTVNPDVLRRVTALPSEAADVDPLVRLKHDQREMPAEVKAAALRLEQDLLEQTRGREEALEASDESLPAV
jgi:hypothetical protein